jgi:hypothetical protein
MPYGCVSIRRVRHAAEEDVLLRVEERRELGGHVSRGLSTRQDYFSLHPIPGLDRFPADFMNAREQPREAEERDSFY